MMNNVKNVLLEVERWFNETSVFASICGGFTLITVINSVMMVVGLDTPKRETFAYVHLLVRLTIISVIICVWEFKEVVEFIQMSKEKLFRKGAIRFNLQVGRDKVATFYKHIPDNRLRSIWVLFTVLTVAICLIAIAGSIFITPQGGVHLYLVLLIQFVVITIIVIGVRSK